MLLLVALLHGDIPALEKHQAKLLQCRKATLAKLTGLRNDPKTTAQELAVYEAMLADEDAVLHNIKTRLEQDERARQQTASRNTRPVQSPQFAHL